MRHRIGVVLAAVMLAELFFAGGWGYLRLLGMPAPGEQLAGLPAGGGSLFSDHRVLAGLAVVAGTGLLAGLLIAMPQISPLAAGLPALVLLGWTGLYLISVRQAVDLIPLRADAFGAGFEAMLLNGTLAAIGFALLVPMLLPSRWRRRSTAADGSAPLAASPAEVTTAPVPVPAATRLEPVASPSPSPSPSPEQASIAPAAETPWTIARRAAAPQSDNAG